MPRPKKPRVIRFDPSVVYYKPRGVPLRNLSEVVIAPDEMEALVLYDSQGLDQESAAKKMDISQPTFARIISSARRKIATALTEGMAIRIEKI